MQEITEKSGGFIYCISSLGVTGVRKSLGHNLDKQVPTIKKMTQKPVCVGFGISTPEMAKNVAQFSDGVIVGSALVKMIECYGKNKKELFSQITPFLKSLVDAVKSV